MIEFARKVRSAFPVTLFSTLFRMGYFVPPLRKYGFHLSPKAEIYVTKALFIGEESFVHPRPRTKIKGGQNLRE